MKLWDTIKKPFKRWREFYQRHKKRWDEFLQRHKTFRVLWWLIKWPIIVLLFLFLISLLVLLAGPYGYILVLFIFTLIFSPFVYLELALSELMDGNVLPLLVFIFIVVVIGAVVYVFKRLLKWLDEEEGT